MPVEQPGKPPFLPLPILRHHAESDVLRNHDPSLLTSNFKKSGVVEAIRAFFNRMDNIHPSPAQLPGNRQWNMDIKVKRDRHGGVSKP